MDAIITVVIIHNTYIHYIEKDLIDFKRFTFEITLI